MMSQFYPYNPPHSKTSKTNFPTEFYQGEGGAAGMPGGMGGMPGGMGGGAPGGGAGGAGGDDGPTVEEVD